MTLNRRSILSFFAGGAASAASGVSVREAAASLGTTTAMNVPAPQLPDPDPWDEGFGPCTADTSPADRLKVAARSRVFDVLHQERERILYARPDFPPHIASKKSWSPVFKESVRRREIAIIDAALHRMQREESITDKLLSALGIELPE